MSTRYKPNGYSSVSPYLIVRDAQGVIDFLERAFDATELRRYDDDDGSILHVEVQIDDSVIMLGESGSVFPASSSLIHVYVPDVDAVFQRAIDAGGEVIDEPEQREGDPDRRGSVKDPSGNMWSIATQMG